MLTGRDDPINRVTTASPTTASAEEVARGFVEAWGAFDADETITHLADDADITGLIDWFTTEEVQGTRDELRLLLALLEAQGYQQMLDSCDQLNSSATETTVRCTFEFHALRSDELELGPFSGSYFDLTVRDGEIVRASTNSNSEQFSSQVWSPFASWMEANHPDDAAIIYSSPDANGARLTDEAIPLWEQHTARVRRLPKPRRSPEDLLRRGAPSTPTGRSPISPTTPTSPG